jgi:hypothetical protein
MNGCVSLGWVCFLSCLLFGFFDCQVKATLLSYTGYSGVLDEFVTGESGVHSEFFDETK